MGKGAPVYIYQANTAKNETIIPNDGRFYPYIFEYIRNLMHSVNALVDSLSIQVYPLTYQESESEYVARGYLKKENYLIPAAIVDAQGDLVSFLLVNKNNYKNALVISARKEVIVAIHDAFGISEGDEAFSLCPDYIGFLKADLGLVSETKSRSLPPLDFEEEREEEEEEQPEIVVATPSFEPTKKKKIQDLGSSSEPKVDEEREYVDPGIKRPSFTGGKKGKPGKILLPHEQKKKEVRLPSPSVGKPPKKEEEPLKKTDEETKRNLAKGIEDFKPFFSPNVKKDFRIPVLDKQPEKEGPKPEKPSKTDNNDEIPVKEVVVERPVFDAIKKNKKMDLNRIPSYFFTSSWRSAPTATFYANPQKRDSSIVIYDSKGSKEIIFAPIKKAFLKRRKIELFKDCCFTPSAPEATDPFPLFFTNIDLDKWAILAAYIDAYGRPYSFLLCLKEDPLISFVVAYSDHPFVFSISSQGYYIPVLRIWSQDLFEDLFVPKPEPIPTPQEEKTGQPPLLEETSAPSLEETLEEQAVAESPDPAPASEEIETASRLTESFFEPKSFPEKEKFIERRKVYFTPFFQKRVEDFLSRHQNPGREEFESFILKLQSLDQEEFVKFLTSRHHDRIEYHKVRFSNYRDYSAARVFYLTGDEFESLGRKIEPDSLVLFSFSEQGEHENQLEVEEKGIAAMQRNSTILCFPSPASETRNQQLYVLSSIQHEVLLKGESDLPAAFVGAAGSGKTLLSYQAYLDLCQNKEEKVLYLTYEKELAKKARETFEELGVENTDVLTFKELMTKADATGGARRLMPRFKNNFRMWFFESYRAYNTEFRRQSDIISPNPYDAFSTSYVFFRGVIEGSLDLLDKKDEKSPILSKEEFLTKVEGEDGISKEQKEAIYYIAAAYERHLRKEGGVTDNKFALRLIRDGKRDIYDAVVVDEYQDLSELQLYAITTVLKRDYECRFLLFGDDNQAVNPTILTLSGVKSVVFKAFHRQLHVESLTETYRAGKALFSYIVDVLRLKDKAIGLDSKENTAPKDTFRDDENDLFITLIDNPDTFEPLLLAASRSDEDAVFIFPSAYHRDEAKKRYGHLVEGYVEDNFLSVEESKGREWNSCVLVDFVTSSKDIFESMLGEERAGHRSTLHRMHFNRYYVALTRAKNRVVVFESDAGEQARGTLLSPLTHIEKEEEIGRIFAGDLNPKHWVGYGDELFAQRRYIEASRAYRRGIAHEGAAMKLQKCEKYRLAFEGEMDDSGAISLLIGYNDLDGLDLLYQERNLYSRKTLLDILRDDTLTLQEKTSNYESLLPSLFDCEKVLYFGELARQRKKQICAMADSILKKHAKP